MNEYSLKKYNKNIYSKKTKREQESRIRGIGIMPLRGVKSRKRTRQYEHIKASALRQGRPVRVAKRIAAATVNKTRKNKGETKS